MYSWSNKVNVASELLELAKKQEEYIKAMMALCQDWQATIDELTKSLLEEQPPKRQLP